MNEWASKIMSMSFQNGPGTRADFDRYINEIRRQNLEYMSYNREFDEDLETRPSFEQVSQESIIDEANKNIFVLKSLENIMQERSQAYNQFLTTLSKCKQSFEVFQYCSGTLRQSLDAFFIFIEQELQQAKQQLALNDIRRSLSEVKVDAQKRLSDYQREILNAEKEVVNAEKKLAKTKEQLEKHLHWKEHLETESSVTGQPISRLNSSGSSRGTGPREHSSRSIERVRESEELTLRYERDIKDDIRGISRALTARDEVLLASRKAFENLDRDCKRVIGSSLKKLISRERETNAARNAVLDKLEDTIDKFDVDSDITEFILTSREPETALILHSQALNILGDLNQSAPSDSFYKYNAPEESETPSTSTHDDSNNRFGNIFHGPGVVMTQNTQAFSNILFSVHNMIGNAQSLFSAPQGQNGGTTVSPSRGGSLRMSQEKRHSATSAAPSHDNKSKSPMSSNSSSKATSDGSADESAMEYYLNCIFYAKKGFEISAAGAVAAALKKSPTAGKLPFLTAEDAYNHCVSTMNNQQPITNQEKRLTNSHLIPLEEAVIWLTKECEKPEQRTMFITELNKFRSKKVDVGTGFMALGAVVWTVLKHCQSANDVHCAKTFYRKRVTPLKKRASVVGENTSSLTRKPSSADKSDQDSQINTGGSSSPGKKTDAGPSDAEKTENSLNDIDGQIDIDESETDVDRGVEQREYLKEILVSHPIWQDGNFWEQVLWQCAIEQLQTIPYSIPWHDMDGTKRSEMVIRIHNVIFSQVMAIAHSMMELGCGKPMIREFVYRMCVIHQLSEAQRQQMLVHLLTR